MDLTFEQIKSVTFGATDLSEAGDGICFSRCTSKQIEVWQGFSDFLGRGARCTTGIRLDFHTDAKGISFYASVGNKFDVYVDGLFRKKIEMNGYRERGEIPYLNLTDPLGTPKKDGEETRVTIWMPSHESAVLSSVSLDDGASIIPHRFDMKMLFIGDSITQGWNSECDSFAFAPRVASFFNAESINQGIGGSFFEAASFDKLDFDPDVTVVAYGTNDWGKRSSAEELYSHAAAHLSLIRDAFGGKKKRIFAVSPIWRDDPSLRPMGSFSDCREAVIRAISDVGLIHVDGLALVPPRPELYADKNLHPNDLGFGLYAENLTKAILSHTEQK